MELAVRVIRVRRGPEDLTYIHEPPIAGGSWGGRALVIELRNFARTAFVVGSRA